MLFFHRRQSGIVFAPRLPGKETLGYCQAAETSPPAWENSETEKAVPQALESEQSEKGYRSREIQAPNPGNHEA